jgi:predicted secreted protein
MTKEDLESQLEDADQVMRDALNHQQAAYEGKIKLLRDVIHDLAGAFARLNTSAEICYRRPDVVNNAEFLELDRNAAMEKFNKALDRLK